MTVPMGFTMAVRLVSISDPAPWHEMMMFDIAKAIEEENGIA